MEKTLVATVLEQYELQQLEVKGMLLRLEAKFIVFYQLVFGLSFEVTAWDQKVGEGTMEVREFPDVVHHPINEY
jgi:hypothetical protein